MISAAIAKAVQTASRKLTDLFVPATYISRTSTYDVASGQNVLASSEQTISGIPDTFEFKEVDGVNVLQDDVKFNVLTTNNLAINPLLDQIRIGEVTYNIVKHKVISAGTKNILYIIQLRA